jgi:hypothetical protein
MRTFFSTSSNLQEFSEARKVHVGGHVYGRKGSFVESAKTAVESWR